MKKEAKNKTKKRVCVFSFLFLFFVFNFYFTQKQNWEWGIRRRVWFYQGKADELASDSQMLDNLHRKHCEGWHWPVRMGLGPTIATFDRRWFCPLAPAAFEASPPLGWPSDRLVPTQNQHFPILLWNIHHCWCLEGSLEIMKRWKNWV